MQSLTVHTHVGNDGILKLETPIGVSNTDIEVTLIVNPVSEARPLSEWTSDFFTKVIGGWQGAPFVREPQGSYESRSEFK